MEASHAVREYVAAQSLKGNVTIALLTRSHDARGPVFVFYRPVRLHSDAPRRFHHGLQRHFTNRAAPHDDASARYRHSPESSDLRAPVFVAGAALLVRITRALCANLCRIQEGITCDRAVRRAGV